MDKGEFDYIDYILGLEADLQDANAQLKSTTTELAQARVYNGLTEFNTPKELMAWLKLDDTNENEYQDGKYVCSDFAIDLTIAAYNDGKFMGISRISNARHQVCFTIIGNKIWEIDPSTDYIRKVGYVYRGWDEVSGTIAQ